MRKMKILLLSFFGILFLAGGVFAIWSMSHNDSYTANIISTGENPFVTLELFDDVSLNTTLGNVEIVESSKFLNNNGDLDMLFTATETRNDINDSCNNFESDCDVSFELDGVEVNDGENVSISAGTHIINSSIACLQSACPGTIEVSVSLT